MNMMEGLWGDSGGRGVRVSLVPQTVLVQKHSGKGRKKKPEFKKKLSFKYIKP